MVSKQRVSKHSHQAHAEPKNHEKMYDLSVKLWQISKEILQNESSTQNGNNRTEMPTLVRMENVLNDLRNMGNKSKCAPLSCSIPFQ